MFRVLAKFADSCLSKFMADDFSLLCCPLSSSYIDNYLSEARVHHCDACYVEVILYVKDAQL
jgi:hypothetical protein